MSKSIMQKQRECYLCRKLYDIYDYGEHRHHVIFGTANRRQSEKYGCVCWLCMEHHEKVHRDVKLAELLKMDCQAAFERIYDHETWMDVFGRNYLEI